MFCNSSGDYVEPRLIWLARELTAQPDEDISYSWGSAILADTYRDLCDAYRQLTSRGSILGCLLLLQMWSWEYLPTSHLWVKKTYYPIPISNDIPDTMRPTMGYRWMFARLRWMHIDRAEMLRRTMKAGSSRSKPGRWSRMAAAICSLGGCVLSSPPDYDTPDMDPSRHSRSRRSTSTLSAQSSDAGVRRDTNIMDAVGPSSPHSNVRETLTPMCRQPEFDS
jgi:hypothetical protein